MGVERLPPDLATFPSLRRLDLTALHLSTGIDDDGVAALTHLPLEELRLDMCVKLTDRTIVALARMSSLKVLSLAECARMTAEGLTALERSSGLRWPRIGLDLVGTKRDRQARQRARDRLRRALPACRVE